MSNQQYGESVGITARKRGFCPVIQTLSHRNTNAFAV